MRLERLRSRLVLDVKSKFPKRTKEQELTYLESLDFKVLKHTGFDIDLVVKALNKFKKQKKED